MALFRYVQTGRALRTIYSNTNITIKKALMQTKGYYHFFCLKNKKPGNDLLSHRIAPAVSSARESLTAVFGMVTGVTSPL